MDSTPIKIGLTIFLTPICLRINKKLKIGLKIILGNLKECFLFLSRYGLSIVSKIKYEI